MEKQDGCILCKINDTKHSHKPFYEFPSTPKDAVSDVGGVKKVFKKSKKK